MSIFGNSREKQMAQMQAPQLLKIAKDCANMVNTTINPEVFFSRFDLLIETVKQLASIERLVRFTGTQPSQQLQIINGKREEETKRFILRAYEKASGESMKLKTEKGREKKIASFFGGFQEYSTLLSADNLQLIEELKKGSQDFF